MVIYYPLVSKEVVRITLSYTSYKGAVWTMKLQDGTTIANSIDRYSLEQYAKNKHATIEHACSIVDHWDSSQYNCPECN